MVDAQHRVPLENGDVRRAPLVTTAGIGPDHSRHRGSHFLKALQYSSLIAQPEPMLRKS
jgi:hypothetical protein